MSFQVMLYLGFNGKGKGSCVGSWLRRVVVAQAARRVKRG